MLLNGGIRKCYSLNEKDSKFKGLIDLNNLGAFGHSQGGGVALLLSRKDAIKATVALQPSPFSCSESKHPILILTGGRDVIVWPFSS